MNVQYLLLNMLHYCYHFTQLENHLYEETVSPMGLVLGHVWIIFNYIYEIPKFQKLVRDDENCSPIHLDSTRIGRLTHSINNSSWGLCLKHAIFTVFWYTHIFVLLWPSNGSQQKMWMIGIVIQHLQKCQIGESWFIFYFVLFLQENLDQSTVHGTLSMKYTAMIHKVEWIPNSVVYWRAWFCSRKENSLQ